MNIKKIESIIDLVTSKNYQHPWNDNVKSIIKNNKEFYHYFAQGNLDGSGAMYPFMYELVKQQKPNHVVELGNREGMGILSIYSALKENQFGSLTTIDVINDLRFVPETIKNDRCVDFLFGDVNDDKIVNCVKEKGTIDLILFDTIHTYIQIRNEWENYVKLFSDNAIILIDDLNYEKNYNNSKQRFFDELKEYKNLENKKLHSSGFGILLFDKIIFDKKESLNNLSADDFWEAQQ